VTLRSIMTSMIASRKLSTLSSILRRLSVSQLCPRYSYDGQETYPGYRSLTNRITLAFVA
jgi:hypothetical protein